MEGRGKYVYADGATYEGECIAISLWKNIDTTKSQPQCTLNGYDTVLAGPLTGFYVEGKEHGKGTFKHIGGDTCESFSS